MASKHDCEPTKNLSLAETHSEPMNLKVKSPGEASHMGRASAPKSGTYVPSDEQFFHLNTVKGHTSEVHTLKVYGSSQALRADLVNECQDSDCRNKYSGEESNCMHETSYNHMSRTKYSRSVPIWPHELVGYHQQSPFRSADNDPNSDFMSADEDRVEPTEENEIKLKPEKYLFFSYPGTTPPSLISEYTETCNTMDITVLQSAKESCRRVGDNCSGLLPLGYFSSRRPDKSHLNTTCGKLSCPTLSTNLPPPAMQSTDQTFGLAGRTRQRQLITSEAESSFRLHFHSLSAHREGNSGGWAFSAYALTFLRLLTKTFQWKMLNVTRKRTQSLKQSYKETAGDIMGLQPLLRT
ncbi:hypothetical protein Anapl_17408 [Anas platyrhynchos]|uniref:Uncharacterized protein n=1 Tax=Anas platyrhynchos TaxID=8839 RepID=R0JSC0_ANAPL|nr:hypothetical protein Anapl_17408 [Anas platyrhynchos]